MCRCRAWMFVTLYTLTFRKVLAPRCRALDRQPRWHWPRGSSRPGPINLEAEVRLLTSSRGYSTNDRPVFAFMSQASAPVLTRPRRDQTHWVTERTHKVTDHPIFSQGPKWQMESGHSGTGRKQSFLGPFALSPLATIPTPRLVVIRTWLVAACVLSAWSSEVYIPAPREIIRIT